MGKRLGRVWEEGKRRRDKREKGRMLGEERDSIPNTVSSQTNKSAAFVKSPKQSATSPNKTTFYSNNNSKSTHHLTTKSTTT